MSVAVDFKNVDIVFGENQKAALAMLDAGADRAEILDKTGQVLGAAGASLEALEAQQRVVQGLDALECHQGFAGDIQQVIQALGADPQHAIPIAPLAARKLGLLGRRFERRWRRRGLLCEGHSRFQRRVRGRWRPATRTRTRSCP